MRQPGHAVDEKGGGTVSTFPAFELRLLESPYAPRGVRTIAPSRTDLMQAATPSVLHLMTLQLSQPQTMAGLALWPRTVAERLKPWRKRRTAGLVAFTHVGGNRVLLQFTSCWVPIDRGRDNPRRAILPQMISYVARNFTAGRELVADIPAQPAEAFDELDGIFRAAGLKTCGRREIDGREFWLYSSRHGQPADAATEARP